ncbi:phosducin-like 2, isoform CRA_a [Mus musculus]|nr:phosducin-like 2, isoform CRA_a [Mus musculus]
MQLNHMRR